MTVFFCYAIHSDLFFRIKLHGYKAHVYIWLTKLCPSDFAPIEPKCIFSIFLNSLHYMAGSVDSGARAGFEYALL